MPIQVTDQGDVAGPMDAFFILLDTRSGLYHGAFFEAVPLPGPFLDDTYRDHVRLVSKYTHREGAKEIEGAQKQVQDLRKKVRIPDDNVFIEEAEEWDGKQGMVLMKPVWWERETPA